MKMPIGICLSFAIATVAVPSGFAVERDPANLVGVKACGICHNKEETGKQLDLWKASPHAKAFEVLGTPQAKEAGAKRGVDNPQTSPKCLKCHSTAYHFSEEVKTEKIKLEEGISCESCHGPGKKYMPKKVMENRDDAIANGLVYPATESCTQCHNEESPSWDPNRYTTKDGKKVGFDAEQAYEKIKHENPKLHQ